LMALLTLSPDDPRIDKLARGLRARRQGGRWRTTQENAFALLALADYAAARESESPDHTLRAWVGQHQVLVARGRGFDTTEREASLALDAAVRNVGPDHTLPVVFERRGRGRVHYRVGVTWAQADPPPRAQGLVLTQRIENEHGRVMGDELVAGERYLLDVTLTTEMPQSFVAVEIPLAAGLEAIDLQLGGGQRARLAAQRSSPFASHVELRRDRALVFFDHLSPGTHTHTIVVLATTPGRHALPGASAEAMYEPETRARAAGTRIHIRRE
jgi:alpha-2-macroglobulin